MTTTNGNAAPLGIVAGGGNFPLLVAEKAAEAGRPVVVVGFKGHTDTPLEDKADAFRMLHLGQFGKLIRFFKSHGVSELCFAGAINKPKALDLRPDWRAVRIMLRLRTKGDNALFKAIFEELESEQFRMIQAATLVPSLYARPGVYTPASPSPQVWADLAFGWKVAKTMGSLDIGQTVVVKDLMVVAVEAIEGTDAAILRAGELVGPGCVVVKTVKPGQDERIDLPAVGAGTVRSLITARAACLGFEAGKALFFDPQESIDLATPRNISLVGLNADILARHCPRP